MVLNFALSLSFEGISLLRRTNSGWARIEDVSLAEPDLDAAMARLKDRAQSLDPKGDKVLLILPNEQIRYLDLPDQGGDAPARMAAAKAALDGATPYAVDDLAFDHSSADGRLMVAAVARETLDEAETFAATHGFQPVAMAAKAPAGAFSGLVWFGAANAWGKRKVTKPGKPITIIAATEDALKPVAARKKSAPPAAEPAPEEPQTQDDLPLFKSTAQAAAAKKPAPVDEAAAEFDDLMAQAAMPAVQPDRTPEAQPAEDPLAEAQPPAAPVPSPASLAEPEPASDPDPVPAPAEPASATASIRAEQPAPVQANDATETPAPTLDAKDDTPRPAVQMALQANAAQSAKPAAPAAPSAPAPTPTPPPTPAPTIDAAFSSRRKTPPVEAPSRRIAEVKGDLGSGGPIKPRFTPVPSAPQIKMRDEVTPDAPPLAADGPSKSRALRAAAAAGLTARSKPDSEKPAPVPPTPAPSAEAQEKPARKSLFGLLSRKSKKEDLPKAAEPTGQPKVPPAPIAPSDKPVDIPLTRKAAPAETVEPAAPAPAASEPGAVQTGVKAAARLAAITARARKPAKPEAPASAPEPAPLVSALTSVEERERMTVFGARNRAPVGGKPRFLGLTLTLGLLAFLLGVAAWASVFMDNGIARLFRDAPPVQTASVTLPQSAPETTALSEPQPAPEPDAPAPVVAPTLETLAAPLATDQDVTPEAEAQEDVQLAALETEPEPNPAQPALRQPLSPVRAPTAAEAEVSYAATGIWQLSPSSSSTPPTEGVDDVYVASIDPSVRQFDAVALPTALSVAPEPGLPDQGLPPPADMRFDFDPRGLIRATPQGALSPQGLRIYTGLPPVVPPLREAALRPAPTAVVPQPDASTDEATPAALPSAALFRPEARPSDLVEQRERATLGGISRQELAAYRPLLRPQTAQEEAQTAEPESPATDQAVSRSLVPVNRPRDMASIVQRAENQRVVQAPVRTAAVAPRTVQPSAPTATSVSRAATVPNAINLNRVALIGVYGTASNRRALVRLPNGQYEKVKTGDRLDGGRVTAIKDSELLYNKAGRSLTLKMPRG